MSTFSHRVYTGTVSHNRYQPKKHGFQYKLFYLYLDLDGIENVNQLSRFWSSNKRNLVEYRRSDYFKAVSHDSLKDSVCDYIKQETGKLFEGKVFVLTNLRYWGYCFNPISYYFCYGLDGNLQYIVDNVTNTPWGESHIYLHDVTKESSSSQESNGNAARLNVEFDKAFHVSPFMPMNLIYKTQYKIDADKLFIHMNLSSNDKHESNQQKENQTVFSATMNMRGEALTPNLAAKLPWIYPMQCSKIMFGIYWQALRLWLKKVPFHSNPTQ